MYSKKPYGLGSRIRCRHKLRIYLALLLAVVFFACASRTKPLQVLDFGVFKIKAPADWHMVKKQGVDSYVGGLYNGQDSIWFDCGRYDVDLDVDSVHWMRLAEDTVNGFPAVVSIPDSLQQGVVSMKIPALRESGRFTIWASKVKDLATVLRIYKSVVFKGSDTSANRALVDVSRFAQTNVDGKALFQAECASCHPVKGRYDGPTIRGFLGNRDADWLHAFFTDSSFRAHDKLHQKYLQVYNNVDCAAFGNMTREDAIALFYFIKLQPR
jgi:hypothetical protein